MTASRRDVRGLFALSCVLLLLAGCSLFGGEDARVRFNISRKVFTSNDFTITFSDGRSQHRLTVGDFSGDAPTSPELSTDFFETATAGHLQVAFTLERPDGTLISDGRVQRELRENWSWHVTLRTDSASANPVRGCFGCVGYHSFPIDTTVLDKEYPSSPDSVYVVWGGNRIDDPVTY